MALTFGIRLKGIGHHGGIEVRFEFVDFCTLHKFAIQVYFKILKFYIRLIP